MATKRNTFIDGVDLSEVTSLIHLLDTGGVDDGNEAQVLKHEFEAFINRMNVINHISAICLQKCWLREYVDVNMFK